MTTSTREKLAAPNTMIMIAAALVMVDAVALKPSIVAWLLRPVRSNDSLIRESRKTS